MITNDSINQKRTNIRVIVDKNIYSILKSEQKDYRQATGQKIALSDILMHYFKEGYNNSNAESKYGLGMVQPNNIKENVQNSDQNLKDKLNPKESFTAELSEISRKLDKIESQTKKSTLDIILQFVGPLISLIGFFQLNKKIKDSSPELNQIQQQFQSIIANLEPKEQEELMSYVNQLQKEKSA
jgi:hypothetical protein